MTSRHVKSCVTRRTAFRMGDLMAAAMSAHDYADEHFEPGEPVKITISIEREDQA